MSPVDADVALAVTVTASFRQYCFTFSAPSTAFALLKHDMFTYIVPLMGVSVHSGAGSGVGVLVSVVVLVVGSGSGSLVGSLVGSGSLVAGSVGAVDVLSTLEITVLELLIAVETSELALSTLETAEDTTELSALVSLVEVDTDTASEFSLVSLALQPESKIAEVKKTVKNFAFSSFFVLFSKFEKIRFLPNFQNNA